jgi:hypothetical protein
MLQSSYTSLMAAWEGKIMANKPENVNTLPTLLCWTNRPEIISRHWSLAVDIQITKLSNCRLIFELWPDWHCLPF